jgi:hypothetical protein
MPPSRRLTPSGGRVLVGQQPVEFVGHGIQILVPVVMRKAVAATERRCRACQPFNTAARGLPAWRVIIVIALIRITAAASCLVFLPSRHVLTLGLRSFGPLMEQSAPEIRLRDDKHSVLKDFVGLG